MVTPQPLRAHQANTLNLDDLDPMTPFPKYAKCTPDHDSMLPGASRPQLRPRCCTFSALSRPLTVQDDELETTFTQPKSDAPSLAPIAPPFHHASNSGKTKHKSKTTRPQFDISESTATSNDESDVSV